MFTNILLCLDIENEETWRDALPAALDLCQLHGASLRLMLVVPDFRMAMVSQFFPEDFENSALGQAKKALQTFADEHVPSGIKYGIAVGHGPIPHEIVRIQKEAKCDLIVMHAAPPKLQDMMVRPNVTAVMRHATCSVLIVRND